MANKKSHILHWTVVTGALALVAAASLWFTQNFRESFSLKEPGYYPKLPDFSCMDQDGKPFGSRELRGKVWAVDFIFTRCSGQCLAMSRNFSQLQKLLNGCEDIQLVSFTIDSENDSAEVLRNYGNGYDADFHRWHFLTGDQESIHHLIIHSFLLPISRTPEERVAIEGGFTHSSRFVLVDRKGNIRGYVEGIDPDSPRQARAALVHLMRE